MLQLYLTIPPSDENGDNNLVDQTKSHLKELESVLWSLISSGHLSEARLWLCNSLADISSVTPLHQQELFLALLRSKKVKQQRLAAQILQLIFDKHPHIAGPIISKKSYLLEDFFKGNSKHILQWFSNFGGSVGMHGKGAKALSQFAFVNRDICWEELEWRGKHGKSPAMVATNPHYFLDLDVERTVENFLEYVPEFWSSVDFSESLKDGAILSIDKNFFIEMFLDLMYKDNMKDVWEIIDSFLKGESFSTLCHHLLVALEEEELAVLLDLIPRYLNPCVETVKCDKPSSWLEMMLSKCHGNNSIDQLLLLNAITIQSRQLLLLVREEAGEEEKEKIKNIASQICTLENIGFDTILKECAKRKSLEMMKLLGLQAWAMHYQLLEAYQTIDSWESLFACNRIGFRKCGRYSLLNHDEILAESESDGDLRSSSRTKRKRSRTHQKKKKRWNFDPKEIVDFEEDVFDVLQNKDCNWLLSTDGYSFTWSSVDLPGHLSNYCFCTWLKFIFSK
ncbi:unnamed protein product [Cuscuta epithymum]|uniref:Uncharacterized protein n=1 Tax=Cuscuta epithymum TaxID=186058 RepID=A0AAV0E169_9ASTE|nr:unnamed protein product [Cuscuta epithymum]CAH9129348.1 unnamed protein product [Cuscuta epithymum]